VVSTSLTEPLSTTCSALAADEPLAGTAPYARAWIAIEQPGRWGRDALRSDVLPHGVGPILADHAKVAQVGVLLVRHPNRPRALAAGEVRRVWIAVVESQTLVSLDVTDCRDLLSWDFQAIADGRYHETSGRSLSAREVNKPLTLICCHAARDACCALHGRALYDALLAHASAEESSLIWQCSHLGGHRFAPTMLTLANGMSYGRVSLSQAREAIDQATAGLVSLTQARGRTHLLPAVQVADLHLRATLPCLDPRALDYTVIAESPDQVMVQATCTGSPGLAPGEWRVSLARTALATPRPPSCGAEPEPAFSWSVIESPQ